MPRIIDIREKKQVMAEKGRTKFEEKRKTLESILEGKSAFKGGSWGTGMFEMKRRKRRGR